MLSLTAKENISRNFEGIFDVTLREGEQFSGPISIESDGSRRAHPHEFNLTEATAILQMLNKIGIRKAEVSNPLAKGMENLIRNLLMLSERPELFAHVRNNPMDIDSALRLGIDGINILTTVDLQRLSKMDHTLESYLELLANVITQAQKQNVKVSVGIEHGWNIPLTATLPIYRLADHCHVESIRIADTTGIATHWDVREKIATLRELFPNLIIRVHFHNDFLGAVSNGLEALASGANEVDGTLGGGIGERTGTIPSSVLLARFITLAPDIIKKQRYHPEYVTEADNLVAQIVGINLPRNVITSKGAFAHRAGTHIKQVIDYGPTKGTSRYEPFSPGLIGNERLIVNGTNVSGKTTDTQVKEFYLQSGKA
ncbi:hypothetical protein HY612_04055 [Candidatus Roizmanbacteria bacterium]|nr:hypothetical protein [Candidatus Roizmanbacteria bacterium]